MENKLKILSKFLDINANEFYKSDCIIFKIIERLSKELNIVVAIYEESVCIREGGKPPDPKCWCEYLQYSDNLTEQLINICFEIIDVDSGLIIDNEIRSKLERMRTLYPYKLINDEMRFRFLEINSTGFELGLYKSESGQIDDATESSWIAEFEIFKVSGNRKPKNIKQAIDEQIINELKKIFGNSVNKVNLIGDVFTSDNGEISVKNLFMDMAAYKL